MNRVMLFACLIRYDPIGENGSLFKKHNSLFQELTNVLIPSRHLKLTFHLVSMKYPEELVHKYGAKAGVLIYVAKELPYIPQAAMIVKTPEESIDDCLKRADVVPILWPRLFRSSAVEELYGYEGDFPTVEMEAFEEVHERIKNPNYIGPYKSKEDFEFHLRKTIEYIELFPSTYKKRLLKETGRNVNLPDKICVIIAEKSPSDFRGTIIKHPNQDDFYIMTITDTTTQNFDGYYIDVFRSTYSYRKNKGIEPLKGFTQGSIEYVCRNSFKEMQTLQKELETVVSWYGEIAALPMMDSNWTYQLEFGLDPLCLYQARPFKEKAKADFEVKPTERFLRSIAIGITPPEGIDVRVERNLEHRHWNYESINPDNMPSVLVSKLSNAGSEVDLLRNVKASLLYESLGPLAHGDIKAMRKSIVAGLYFPELPLELENGDWINIVSDGKNINCKKKS